MLDRADYADFGCHNSIRLKAEHFLNTLALTFIFFSGCFVFAVQKHYPFFGKRSSGVFFVIYFDSSFSSAEGCDRNLIHHSATKYWF